MASIVLAAGLLLGCSQEAEQTGKDIAYAVSSPLATTNAASSQGAATNAEVLTGRVYPAVYQPGPAGQLIPNTDLVRTQVLPGVQRQVVYTLAEDASYSDGVALSCDDFLLTFTAAKLPELFDTHLPLFEQVDSLDCTSGAKRFSLKFIPGQGARWRYLFGPGEVLPSHAIAARAGLTPEQLHEALITRDLIALAPIAEVWNSGFELAHFDPSLQVSAGPYRITEVGSHGEVTLVRNASYYGDAANIERLVVWPLGTDLGQLATQVRIIAADTSASGQQWFDRNDSHSPYQVTIEAGRLSDSLVIAPEGILNTPEARRSFAACVDPSTVALASSQAAGVEVTPTAAHVLSAIDPRLDLLADLLAPHLLVDLASAEALRGSTVRIGYQGPSERKAAMVEAIAQSCARAGITVVDAGQSSGDAVLKAIDAESEYGAVGLEALPSDLRAAETALWEDPWVIPLAAQPRSFAVDKRLGNVSVYSGLTGIGWNMDRWLL